MSELHVNEACSVGSRLSIPCFLSTFTARDQRIQSIENLSEELRKTICLRTNMINIPSIFKHHLIAFSSKFSQFKRSSKCSNPINLHCEKLGKVTLWKACKKTLSLSMCEAIKLVRVDTYLTCVSRPKIVSYVLYITVIHKGRQDNH
jgi:hypothetical protein